MHRHWSRWEGAPAIDGVWLGHVADGGWNEGSFTSARDFVVVIRAGGGAGWGHEVVLVRSSTRK